MTIRHLSSHLDHTSVDIVIVTKVALLVGAEGASAFCGWFGFHWESESSGQAGENNE